MLTNNSAQKIVSTMGEWAKVAGELQGEDLKQKIYDNTLLGICGDLEGKMVLDYGAGPGIIAKKMADKGADVHVFDISEDMLRIACKVLGQDKIHRDVREFTRGQFDFVTCNLVMCIVPESEVAAIAQNIKNALGPAGRAFIGFCNPKIYDIPESVIDFRFQTGVGYSDNHEYKKKKKEGNYEIVELHRPIEWYLQVFAEAGMMITQIHFTPEYETDGRAISDFVIFEMVRA